MDALSLTFQALADPTRRAILHRLARGEATVNELAKPFDLKLPTVSKHLQVLRNAGLVTQSRRAQWRPCKLEPKPLAAVERWLRFYDHFWNDQLDRRRDGSAARSADTFELAEDEGRRTRKTVAPPRRASIAPPSRRTGKKRS
jgi:DNA-binding transcriptional ArsR family regulator